MIVASRECRSGQTGRAQDALAYACRGSNPLSLIKDLVITPLVQVVSGKI